MTLALGLAAVLVGADLIIAGYTKRPIGRLLLGYWDAPGASGLPTTPAPSAPGNAMTGGAYAPRGSTVTGTARVGGAQ